MSDKNKGVGLVQLVLTIAVMVIISAAVFIAGRDYVSKAKTATLSSDISSMKEEVEIYYALNRSLPVDTLDDGVTPVTVSKTYLPSTLQDGLSDTEDSSVQGFYIVDLDKLEAISRSRGIGTHRG